jgi:broad specificity phosphatase PhoE
MLSNLPLYAADPRLTAIGEEQARSAHTAWEREILRGVPIPQKYYCSPLTRAIRTLELTFVDVLPAHTKPLIVEVWANQLSHVPCDLLTNRPLVQNCREEYGEHTCDKRRTRTEIHSDFPGFAFEEGFEEEDVLWSPERETKESAENRAKLFLDRVFENDCDDICKFTSICSFVTASQVTTCHHFLQTSPLLRTAGG